MAWTPTLLNTTYVTFVDPHKMTKIGRYDKASQRQQEIIENLPQRVFVRIKLDDTWIQEDVDGRTQRKLRERTLCHLLEIFIFFVM